MKILYYSVHQILEYDEIRMFKSMGHELFPLGVYFNDPIQHHFRPDIDLGEWVKQTRIEFRRMGGQFVYYEHPSKQIIPDDFIRLFDLIIVMDDPDVVRELFLNKGVPVVFRTVGAHIEQRARAFAPHSITQSDCFVVRYSPAEVRMSDYPGHDAVIRFPKFTDEYGPCEAQDNTIVTFSNDFQKRFPSEYNFFTDASRGFNVALAGVGNEAIPGNLGMVSANEQLDLMRRCRSYFYCHNTFTPYTLNFIEAWLSGIPVVAVNCRSIYDLELCRFAEIPELIKWGENGFVVGSVGEARSILTELSLDASYAKDIGEEGRRRAVELFSVEVVMLEWKKLFCKIGFS